MESCHEGQSTEKEGVGNFIQDSTLDMTTEKFHKYVSIDDELMTLHVPNNEDIIAKVLVNSAEESDDSDEDTHEGSEPPSTCSTMLEFADHLKRWTSVITFCR